MERVKARWLNQEQQRVWRTYLLAAARISEVLDTDLRQFGIDLGEYEILVCLEEAPEQRLRMSDLAARVHQSRSRLTHTIARMEKQNLVSRESCGSDRRGVWAQLSPAGLELLRSAAPTHVEGVRRIFVEAVGADDFKAVGRAFQAVLDVEY